MSDELFNAILAGAAKHIKEESDQKKDMQEAANEMYTMMMIFINAGFERDEAFELMRSLCFAAMKGAM